MTDVPALIMDRRSDVLAWNRLGHALLAGHRDFAAPDRAAGRPNLTRMLFLDPRTRELYPRWAEEAARAVASLRMVAGRDRDDRGLSELVGELTVQSDEFARLWSRQPVLNCHPRHRLGWSAAPAGQQRGADRESCSGPAGVGSGPLRVSLSFSAAGIWRSGPAAAARARR
jgi:hypothetical protein